MIRSAGGLSPILAPDLKSGERRRLLRLVALAPAMLLLAAFNPRALDTWRRHSLFILFWDSEPSKAEIASTVSRLLAEKLPDSRAAPLAVPSLRQIGEFLVSQQYDVALLPVAQAGALASSNPAASLVQLARIGDHVLISRADLSADHARMIAVTLSDIASKGDPGTADPSPALPWHAALGR